MERRKQGKEEDNKRRKEGGQERTQKMRNNLQHIYISVVFFRSLYKSLKLIKIPKHILHYIKMGRRKYEGENMLFLTMIRWIQLNGTQRPSDRQVCTPS